MSLLPSGHAGLKRRGKEGVQRFGNPVERHESENHDDDDAEQTAAQFVEVPENAHGHVVFRAFGFVIVFLVLDLFRGLERRKGGGVFIGRRRFLRRLLRILFVRFVCGFVAGLFVLRAFGEKIERSVRAAVAGNVGRLVCVRVGILCVVFRGLGVRDGRAFRTGVCVGGSFRSGVIRCGRVIRGCDRFVRLVLFGFVGTEFVSGGGGRSRGGVIGGEIGAFPGVVLFLFPVERGCVIFIFHTCDPFRPCFPYPKRIHRSKGKSSFHCLPPFWLWLFPLPPQTLFPY